MKFHAGAKDGYGQFLCPICLAALGPKRRAFEEGPQAFRWDPEPETPQVEWRQPEENPTQVALRERNVQELKRLMGQLCSEEVAPKSVQEDAQSEPSARPEDKENAEPSVGTPRTASKSSGVNAEEGKKSAEVKPQKQKQQPKMRKSEIRLQQHLNETTDELRLRLQRSYEQSKEKQRKKEEKKMSSEQAGGLKKSTTKVVVSDKVAAPIDQSGSPGSVGMLEQAQDDKSQALELVAGPAASPAQPQSRQKQKAKAKEGVSPAPIRSRSSAPGLALLERLAIRGTSASSGADASKLKANPLYSKPLSTYRRLSRQQSPSGVTRTPEAAFTAVTPSSKKGTKRKKLPEGKTPKILQRSSPAAREDMPSSSKRLRRCRPVEEDKTAEASPPALLMTPTSGQQSTRRQSRGSAPTPRALLLPPPACQEPAQESLAQEGNVSSPAVEALDADDLAMSPTGRRESSPAPVEVLAADAAVDFAMSPIGMTTCCSPPSAAIVQRDLSPSTSDVSDGDLAQLLSERLGSTASLPETYPSPELSPVASEVPVQETPPDLLEQNLAPRAPMQISLSLPEQIPSVAPQISQDAPQLSSVPERSPSLLHSSPPTPALLSPVPPSPTLPEHISPDVPQMSSDMTQTSTPERSQSQPQNLQPASAPQSEVPLAAAPALSPGSSAPLAMMIRTRLKAAAAAGAAGAAAAAARLGSPKGWAAVNTVEPVPIVPLRLFEDNAGAPEPRRARESPYLLQRRRMRPAEGSAVSCMEGQVEPVALPTALEHAPAAAAPEPVPEEATKRQTSDAPDGALAKRKAVEVTEASQPAMLTTLWLLREAYFAHS